MQMRRSLMTQSTQLRFHKGGDPDVASLRTIKIDMNSIDPEHRKLILSRLDDGMDVWAHTWSHLRDGQRTENSIVIRASHRILAREATLASLIEGIQQNEREIMSAPTYKYANALH